MRLAREGTWNNERGRFCNKDPSTNKGWSNFGRARQAEILPDYRSQGQDWIQDLCPQHAGAQESRFAYSAVLGLLGHWRESLQFPLTEDCEDREVEQSRTFVFPVIAEKILIVTV